MNFGGDHPAVEVVKISKICSYCGEYDYDCKCEAARDLKVLIASIRGCLIGLQAHPSDVPLNGCLISEASKLKLDKIGEILDRYEKKV